MASSSGKIRIAINGGGLAGASLFHALLQHQHLNVHIFERATSFREAGAGISITRNALNTLDLLGPSATRCLERAGAVPHLEALLRLAQGPDTGESVSEITDKERPVNVVSRATFLRELLAAAPPEHMHASKTLKAYRQEGEGPLTLQFEDGTEHECDILIGADGIHSRVRTMILGKDDPAASPVAAGRWAAQAVKPYADMRTKLGRDIVDAENARELGWLGDRTFLYTTLLSDNAMVQFVLIGCHDVEQSANGWYGTVSAREVRSLYRDWPPQLSKAIQELVCNEESVNIMYLWEHPHARTYVDGNVCVMGDAAHAMTPWQGSGGGMSIEDSLILSTLLARARCPCQARAALRMYDKLRRGRAQMIVDSSRGTGLILTNQDGEVGQDAGRIRAKLKHRWDYILDFDIEGHRDEAVRTMEERERRHPAEI